MRHTDETTAMGAMSSGDAARLKGPDWAMHHGWVNNCIGSSVLRGDGMQKWLLHGARGAIAVSLGLHLHLFNHIVAYDVASQRICWLYYTGWR